MDVRPGGCGGGNSDVSPVGWERGLVNVRSGE
jgi:hypothetical protein